MKNKLDGKININETLAKIKEVRSLLLIEFLDIDFNFSNISEFNEKTAALNLVMDNIARSAAKDPDKFYNH